MIAYDRVVCAVSYVRFCSTVAEYRKISIVVIALQLQCDFSLVVRERAIPGEVCDLTMRVFGPVSANTIVSVKLGWAGFEKKYGRRGDDC